MRFRYSLQKIVDLKTNEKRQAEWMLTDAIEQLKKEEHTLQELENIKNTLYELMQTSASQSASVHELQTIQHYVLHVDKQIEEKYTDVRRAQGDVEHKQNGLTEKVKEEKVWHRAKEQAYGHFQHHLRRKEQQELDEIAATRFGH